MEAVKSYRVTAEAPRGLIEGYFKVKQGALDVVLPHARVTRKAHLDFKRREDG